MKKKNQKTLKIQKKKHKKNPKKFVIIPKILKTFKNPKIKKKIKKVGGGENKKKIKKNF